MAQTRPSTKSVTHLEKDYGFQRREWQAQRFGLVALLAFVAAAGVGVLGSASIVFRVLTIYGFLLVVFRIAGKRTVAQMTSFDLIVLLLIGDATQQGMLGDDYTVTTAVLAVSCLIVVDVVLGRMKSRWAALDRVVDGVPVILVFKGRLLKDRMDHEGVDVEDILEAAREQEGLDSLDDVEFAVLERHGGVSIIPKKKERSP